MALSKKKFYERFYTESKWNNKRWIVYYHLSVYSKIIKLFPFNKGNVLDIGCGTGEYTNEFFKRKYEVLGVDFSEIAIEKAKLTYTEVPFLCIDVRNLSSDNKYDLIFAKGFSLLNTSDLKKIENILERWKTLLKNRGNICVISRTDFSGKDFNGWFFHSFEDLKEVLHGEGERILIFVHRYLRPFFLLAPANKYIINLLSKLSVLFTKVTKKPTDWILIVNKNEK